MKTALDHLPFSFAIVLCRLVGWPEPANSVQREAQPSKPVQPEPIQQPSRPLGPGLWRKDQYGNLVQCDPQYIPKPRKRISCSYGGGQKRDA